VAHEVVAQLGHHLVVSDLDKLQQLLAGFEVTGLRSRPLSTVGQPCRARRPAVDDPLPDAADQPIDLSPTAA
jgi:hypothetical protein